MGGGGGSPAPSTQTVQQSNIPEYARPYVETMLGATQQQLFNTQQTPEGMTQITGVKPYTPFGAEGAGMGPTEQAAAQASVAGFTPMQQQAFQGIAGLQLPGQFGAATDAAMLATQGALGAGGYQAGYFGNQFRAPGAYMPGQFEMLAAQAPQLQQYQMGPYEQVAGGQYAAPMMETAQTQFRPELQQYQMGPFERVAGGEYNAPMMQAAQTQFRPELERFQMQAPERIETDSFTRKGVAEQYMSPYMEQALAPQIREAQKAADIAATQRAGRAVQSGAFGGTRAALMEAEAQKNLAEQIGDIRGRGLQAAYEQAQQLYGTEQQRAQQAAIANQQAGLTAGGQNLAAALGVQQLGAQTGLQAALANLSSEQQAAVQNQAAQLQTQGLTANQAMQAALANQQAGLTTGQQNLAAQLGIQQLGTQTGLQTALANLSAEQQANVQNQAAQLQAQGLTANQAMQAALANQQAGLTVGQQNLAAQLGIQQLGAGQDLQAQLANQQAYQAAQQAREQSRQFGAGQAMTAAQQRAQYGLAGQQAAEQSRQFGAGLGLQGLGTALTGAGQLAGIGGQQLGALQSIYGTQQQAGGMQQQQQQQIINQMLQNYATTKQYPQQQLAFMNAMLRGLPLQTMTTQGYQAAPSAASQLAGLGLAGAGMYGMVNRKEGGPVHSDERAGLGELALMKMGV